MSSHPFQVESILRGVVTHGSRGELAATLEPVAGAVERVERHLVAADELDAVDVVTCALRHASLGQSLSDADLAAVALGLLEPSVPDAVCTAMRRDEAETHVELWTDAVRRTPPDLRAAPAAVLAFAAWLAGRGALAWCAVDRAVDVEPDHGLAARVAHLLEGAVPPASWEEACGQPAP